jgi:2-hydroxychromene-2-carboxylate isomerase
MVMPHVQFHFDFGSPNAYLAHKLIPEIEKRTGAKFEYVPVLLGGVFKLTNNKPPLIQFGDVKNKLAYETLEMRRFIAHHGLTKFQMNPFFPVNTLMLMRGAVAAESEDKLLPYVDAVFHHMWEAPKDMDDPPVIRAALVESGFDADKLMALAETPEIKAKLLQNTSQSVERGVFGSPSFFVGTELFFGKDRLRDVEEEIARQSA